MSETLTIEKPVIKFAKVRESAKTPMPSKDPENSGWDLFADIEKDYFINRGTTRLVPTGIASEFSKDWTFIIEERGSTGSKGIKKSAGVIDSNFRGEWFVAISNSTYKDIVISVDPEKTLQRLIKVKQKAIKEYYGKDFNPKKFNAKKYVEKNYIIYPVSKAIAQAVFVYTPHIEPVYVKFEELSTSERGDKCLGSTNKKE